MINIDFCPTDNQLLKLIFENGELKKICKCCKESYPINPSDTLLFEKNIKKEQNKLVSNKLLKNIANDDIGVIINKPCKNCKRPFTKLYISDDLEYTMILCPCQWEKK